jgi:hypothetical protein
MFQNVLNGVRHHLARSAPAMSYVTTGLPNGGRTEYFVFQYDDALSTARGRDLARDLMRYVDDDFRLLVGWFSGRGLDMDPPIHVSLNTVATDENGVPTQTVGAEWQGLLTVVLHADVYIGDLPITVGTSTMLARSLLVAEVSEMFMRNVSLPHNNPWFTPVNEGNKGEGLSRFLSAKFVRDVYPDAVALPTVRFSSFNTSNLWLNSMRDNFLEVDDGDIDPNEKIGCATLFLFWLHDELGFSVQQIINAGAGKLSSVYANLTGDSWVNAWPNFSGLVDSHYPHSRKKSFFTPMYDPPFDSIYPVAELKFLDAPPVLSWVVNARENVARVFLTRPLTVDVDVMLASDDPAVAVPESVRTTYSAKVPLTVKTQSAGSTPKDVTLTASYARPGGQHQDQGRAAGRSSRPAAGDRAGRPGSRPLRAGIPRRNLAGVRGRERGSHRRPQGARLRLDGLRGHCAEHERSDAEDPVAARGGDAREPASDVAERRRRPRRGQLHLHDGCEEDRAEGRATPIQLLPGALEGDRHADPTERPGRGARDSP